MTAREERWQRPGDVCCLNKKPGRDGADGSYLRASFRGFMWTRDASRRLRRNFKMSSPAARQTASEVALSETAAWGGACQFFSGLLRTDARSASKKGGDRLIVNTGTRRRRDAQHPCSSGCFPGKCNSVANIWVVTSGLTKLLLDANTQSNVANSRCETLLSSHNATSAATERTAPFSGRNDGSSARVRLMLESSTHCSPTSLCQKVIFSSQAKSASTKNSRRPDSGIIVACSFLLCGDFGRCQGRAS